MYFQDFRKHFLECMKSFLCLDNGGVQFLLLSVLWMVLLTVFMESSSVPFVFILFVWMCYSHLGERGRERERLKCHEFLLSFLLPFWRTKKMSMFMEMSDIFTCKLLFHFHLSRMFEITNQMNIFINKIENK